MFGIGYTVDCSKSNIIFDIDVYAKTCEDSTQNHKNYVKNVIKNLNNVQDFSKTSDYIKYNLYPGQQIRRKEVPIGIIHTAIYLYNGVIIEMGSKQLLPKLYICVKIYNF